MFKALTTVVLLCPGSPIHVMGLSRATSDSPSAALHAALQI
jgi:hypothetical protein